MMPYLLIDNSNTRTKFMRAHEGQLLPEKRVLATAELSEGSLAACLAGWDFEAAFIASVVPRLQPLFELALGCPCHFLSAETAQGLSLADYPDRAHLGADRIANAMAVCHRVESPIIALDLGTAVTYDVVVASPKGLPRFIGGVIAPGLGSLCSCLSFRTALLPTVQSGSHERCIGKNTQEALLAGTTLGFIGMVRETLTALSTELGSRPYLVATGGDATMMAAALDLIDEVDLDLTFKGLLAFAQPLN